MPVWTFQPSLTFHPFTRWMDRDGEAVGFVQRGHAAPCAWMARGPDGQTVARGTAQMEEEAVDAVKRAVDG